MIGSGCGTLYPAVAPILIIIGSILLLGALAHAPVHDGVAQTGVASVGPEALGDLLGQFAGGGKHQGPDDLSPAPGFPFRAEALENGEGEGGRLPGADGPDRLVGDHETRHTKVPCEALTHLPL
jgi:hypothetical protein